MMRKWTWTTILAVGLATPWLASSPAAADSVSVGISTPSVHFGLNIGSPPPLVAVQGLPVHHAPSVPHNYFVYDRYFYLFHEGTWFYSSHHNGPWFSLAIHQVPRPVLLVPVKYYKRVPPGHWKKHGRPDWDRHERERGKHRKHDKHDRGPGGR